MDDCLDLYDSLPIKAFPTEIEKYLEQSDRERNSYAVNLLVTSEAHFSIAGGGTIFGDGPVNYAIWANFLEAFDGVTVLARVGMSKRAWPREARADGPCVTFRALPDYNGPWEYLLSLPKLKALVRQAVLQSDAYLLRVPGLVSRTAWIEINRLRRPYALQVVGDPWDALGAETVQSLLRPAFRRTAARDLKEMCKGAIAVHYVTQTTLQERYPPGKNSYAAGFSDVSMDAGLATSQTIKNRYRRIEERAVQGGNGGGTLHVGFVGSLSQMYKGPDVLLRAAALCRNRRLELIVEFVGDGRYVGALKQLASQLGIADHTTFLGQLPSGKPVRNFLDAIDLFVLPSRAEGLPRALLEAMARGCPCLGSNVGGIPELLDTVDTVPVGDVDGVASKILEVARAPERMKQMAERNFEKAQRFGPEALRKSQRDFLHQVRLRSSECSRRQDATFLRTWGKASCAPTKSEGWLETK
jgi:glycosyltransferase involved in cell wall biosynthesis